ncbi:hypothetical protein [Streptomyces sp. LN245]|uniref:hypothetical protein n=1 Tax=Streptomyces sp. LN245 TaxID=3112975 RepID=UPI0037142606
MPDASHRSQAAQALATHIDHLIAGIRANAETGLPEDAPGMERASELLGLHKAKLLNGDQPGPLHPLLEALAAAFASQGAVESAHALERRWRALRLYTGAAATLRDALIVPAPGLPVGFTRSSMISVSCACCGYTYDEDETHTVLFDSIEEATRSVKDVGWTVLEDGRVLCDSDDADHQALMPPPRPEPVPMCDGQQELATDDACQTVEVDGDTVLVRGGGPMTEDERDLIADVVRTARRQAEAEQPS